MPKNLRTDSTAWLVYDEIQRIIQDSEEYAGIGLKPGNFTNNIEESQKAVEQALTRALGERLVNMGNGRCYSAGPDITYHIRHLSKVREILELSATKSCIINCEPEHFQHLHEICDDFSALVKKGIWRGLVRLIWNFTKVLYAFQGTPFCKRHTISPIFRCFING